MHTDRHKRVLEGSQHVSPHTRHSAFQRSHDVLSCIEGNVGAFTVYLQKNYKEISGIITTPILANSNVMEGGEYGGFAVLRHPLPRFVQLSLLLSLAVVFTPVPWAFSFLPPFVS